MATKTDDLFVVSRGGVNYKATGSQLFDFEGGATFGGATKIQPSGSSEINDNNAFAINYSDGTPKVSMTGNGSATFADQITATKGYALAQLPTLP